MLILCTTKLLLSSLLAAKLLQMLTDSVQIKRNLYEPPVL